MGPQIPVKIPALQFSDVCRGISPQAQCGARRRCGHRLCRPLAAGSVESHADLGGGRLGKWPKVIGGVRSWRGIKFDEFSFEVKKCGDGQAAEELMQEFLESDGLDHDFCQSAFDTVHLAYKQRRPPEEIALLQDMATMLMRAHRQKVQLPEEFLADALLMCRSRRRTRRLR